MEHSGITKFTRLLPLSIRKESGGSCGGSIFPQNPSSSGHGSGDRAFSRNPRNAASDYFRDPFESHNSESHSPSSRSTSEQKEVVRVTYPSPAVGALNPHKEIALRITNDENPTFFYHLRIQETDYPMIKSQQGLLVDFYGFPNQLITLLERCDPNSCTDQEDSRSLSSSGPKFVMVMKLGMNSVVLDIVESNPFKYLCHLSLQINPGTDAEIKKYLADVTTHMKKEKSLLEEKFSHMSSASDREIQHLKKMVGQKDEEIRQMREEMHSQASSLSNKHFQDMTSEKEKLLQMQSELASKFESERQEIDRRHSQAVTGLENRIASLEAENRDLIQTKFKNETVIQSAHAKIKNMDGDLKLLQQELTLARKQNERLDSDYHEKQKLANTLQNKLGVLEGDLKEKQNTLQRQQDYIAQLSEQKKFLEDHATNMVKENERLKTSHKNGSSELIKANEIIRKLQDDIRTLHTKNKLQAQIAQEQERRIIDKEKQMHQLEEANSRLTGESASLKENAQQLKEQMEALEEKIEQQDNTIKSNENMITWLNKQLNEFQGLGKLQQFRQNLNAATQGPGIGSAHLGRSTIQDSLGQANSSNVAVQGSIRNGGLFSTNLQNTLPNTSPSWLNVYQSTSTPLDNDLSSRLERISASNNNYSLGRSRLDAISERASEVNNTGECNDEENRNPSGNQKRLTITEKTTATAIRTGNGKPPTWTKPRSGKVTLEVSAPAKVNQIWKNK